MGTAARADAHGARLPREPAHAVRQPHEARTDSLTGLRNRRSLMADLEAQLGAGHRGATRARCSCSTSTASRSTTTPSATPPATGCSRASARGWPRPSRPTASAYRLGGDEFCVLPRPGRAGVDAARRPASAALSERGEGFEVTTSLGVVRAPEEADTPTEALQLADRRMYARKGGRRMSAGRQSRDVLLRTLSERAARAPRAPARHRRAGPRGRPRAGHGPRGARRGRPARRSSTTSARSPCPTRSSTSPGRSTESSGASCAATPLIGERILLAAPALRPVARLVRSSHERWDGGGYPDGLAGDEIPLGARVVAVCDAFDAMTTDRPYREPVSGRRRPSRSSAAAPGRSSTRWWSRRSAASFKGTSGHGEDSRSTHRRHCKAATPIGCDSLVRFDAAGRRWCTEPAPPARLRSRLARPARPA